MIVVYSKFGGSLIQGDTVLGEIEQERQKTKSTLEVKDNSKPNMAVNRAMIRMQFCQLKAPSLSIKRVSLAS